MDNYIDSLYMLDGERRSYQDLSEEGKSAVKQAKALLLSEMREILSKVQTGQVIDDEKPILIIYSRSGINHLLNDWLLTLSGRGFTKEEMLNINTILEKAKYIPTSHGLKHPRKDGRELWFSYQPEGKEGYILKVTKKKSEEYELYSIVDK